MEKTSCPGSRTIKNPMPEYLTCPNCGNEVEIWTNEISYPCSRCGTRVFRSERPSCIDWCPHAKECIGPDVYANLKVTTKGKDASGEDSPLNVVSQEHDEAVKKLGLLRAAALCLRAGARMAGSRPAGTIERSVRDLDQVMAFLDNEIRTHFRLEEDVLFPMVEKHIGAAGSPTQMLKAEHVTLWQEHDALEKKFQEVKNSCSADGIEATAQLHELGSQFARSLQSHIDKENTSLLPIARKALGKKELDEISRKWHA